MSDDRLTELLRSPLDDRPGGGWRAWLPTASLSAAAGVLVAVAVVAFTGGGDEEVSAKVATTVTTAAVAPAAVLPEGFTPITGEFGVRPDWLVVRGDQLYVSLASAVTAGTEPEVVKPMDSGLWFWGTEPDAVESTVEYADPDVAGRITVEFDAADPGGAAALRVIPGSRSTTSADTTVPVTAMPLIVPAGAGRFPLGGGVDLVVDGVFVDDVTGSAAWHLEGGSSERARIGLQVDLMAGGELLGTVFSKHLLGTVAFLRETAVPPGPSREGITDLALPFGSSIDLARVDGAVFHWTVDLFRYDRPPVTIPLELTPVFIDTG